MKHRILLLVLVFTVLGGMLSPAAAQDATALAADNPTIATPMGIRLQFMPGQTSEEYSSSIQFLILMTVLSLVPSIFIMTTSFMRIMVVFGFLRRALGTQTAPANQVLAAMSLFLTIFIMAPVWQKINEDAIKPFIDKEITQKEAWALGVEPLREFMEKQTGEDEIVLFTELRNPDPQEVDEDKGVPLEILVPAFMLSELKIAFQMGFLIYLPFLIIDLVISSSLMSLGMMMLPPMMISMPIKILFFVLADGWTMMVRGLVTSFNL
jgi:flagellar biosynthetic protein FliP